MDEVPAKKKYNVINEMSLRGYPIQLLCSIAGVSKSGYNKWVKRHLSSLQKQIENQAIKEKILECHKKVKGIYGY
ncbi:transposase [Cytobacillus horneckiae]|uniref:transposase n=1 Tax=Cytobacillus horneckiae TaxID=549687 RepID=UPI0039A33623